MNVPLIQETPAAARDKLRAYRKAIHTRADEEYKQLATAYAQLAKGRPLIGLVEAFAAAPLDDAGRVRLAIAPATWPQVAMDTNSAGRWRFSHARGWRARGLHSRWQLGVTDPRAVGNRMDGFALVPMIPPNVRGTHALASCCVLWEVEQWASSVIGATPDRDPLLIRRIGDGLYVVLGEWELTPLEQAIMAGRRLA